MGESDRQPPPDAADAAAMGGAIRTFRASASARLTMAGASVVVLLVGLICPFAVADVKWTGWMSSMWFAGPVVLGSCGLLLAWAMGKTRYDVHRDAVVRRGLRGPQVCRWAAVAEARDERVEGGRWGNSRTIVLVGNSGARVEFGQLGIPDYEDFASLLREQATARGIPWTEDRKG